MDNKLDKVKAFLKPEHFYLEANRIIYQSCLELPSVDLSTLVIKLRQIGQLEHVGGAFYLAGLMSEVVSSLHLEFHARILIEFALKRKLILMCGEVFEEAYKDSSDCFEVLAIAEREVKEIQAWIK